MSKSERIVKKSTKVSTVRSKRLSAKRGIVARLNGLRRAYLARRPHRSFRLTRSRDAQRSLKLPGYWAFTLYVIGVLRRHKGLFTRLIVVYTLAGALLVGLSSQDTYAQLSNLLDETGSNLFEGGWGYVGQAGLLLGTSISGGLSPELTEAQQIYGAILLLLTWLTTVWLVRGIIAGKTPRLRDGLYNGGAPIVATGAVMLVLLIQLVPAAVGIIVASSAASTELFQYGIMAMAITLLAVLLVMLSIYWIVSTILALVVVTLPGMYPWQAIRTAGDLVIGRRVRILLRFAWMLGVGVLTWITVVLPVVILTRLLASAVSFVDAIPIVPIVMAVMSASFVVWAATYIYLLYRKVVEDDARPA